MVGVASAFAVALVVGLAVRRMGPSLGYVDVPDDPTLKVHTRAAVPLGGVAVFAGLHVGLAFVGAFDRYLFASTSVLLVLGLVDDRRGLAPRVRLGVEVIAGAILAAGLVGDAGVGVAIAVAMLVVVSVNAVNLFDGLDGLAGSVAMLSAIGASLFALTRSAGATPGLVLAAALAGFLILNWHPASVFFGDNGAYMVGAALVAMFARPSEGAFDLGIGAGVLGLFLVDLAATVLRRRIAGVPMFIGDRSHIYDRIHARGHSVPVVVVTVAALHILVVGSVLVLDWRLPTGAALASTVAVAVVSLVVASWGAGAATSR